MTEVLKGIIIDKDKLRLLLKVDATYIGGFGLYLDIEPGSIKGYNKPTDDRVGAPVVLRQGLTYETLQMYIKNAERSITNFLFEHEWAGLRSISRVVTSSPELYSEVDGNEVSQEEFNQALQDDLKRLRGNRE